MHSRQSSGMSLIFNISADRPYFYHISTIFPFNNIQYPLISLLTISADRPYFNHISTVFPYNPEKTGQVIHQYPNIQISFFNISADRPYFYHISTIFPFNNIHQYPNIQNIIFNISADRPYFYHISTIFLLYFPPIPKKRDKLSISIQYPPISISLFRPIGHISTIFQPYFPSTISTNPEKTGQVIHQYPISTNIQISI
jgi:hypothetical protein